MFAVAFLTTRLLLTLHVHSMGLRYLAASVTGYAAFFGLLRAWLWYVTTQAEADLHPGAPRRGGHRDDPDAPIREDAAEVAATGDAAPGEHSAPEGPRGCRRHRLHPRREPGRELGSSSAGSGSGGGSSSGGGGFDVDGDGLVAILVIAVIALVAAVVFGAAGYVVYQAPALLGEAAFEAVLASVLARSSRRVTTRYWTGACSRRPEARGPDGPGGHPGRAGGAGAVPGAQHAAGVVKQCVTEKEKR